MFLLAPSLMAATAPAPKAGGKAAVLTVVGSINAGTADYISEGIKRAKAQGASIVVLQLDTPGGFLQATREIVKSILNAPLPVAVFVSPGGARAGSAGVFITLAGHIAAMSPGTNIGAAHPVTSGGKDPEKSGGKHMAKKIENDTVAFIEAIARKRKRNFKWARKAVLESDSITWRKALELKVIDVAAVDIRSLLQKIHGKEVLVGQQKVTLLTKSLRIEKLDMTFKQKVVNFFASPQIFYFLMMFGVLGIMAEIYHPGSIFPGVLGSVCLLLGLVAMQALPINYGGLALILLGVVLFVAEVFTPTFGVLFVGGLISLTIGSIFLIDAADPAMQLSLSTILPAIGTLAVLLGAAMFAMVNALGRPIETGSEAMIGETATVYAPLAPKGKVRYAGTLWSAVVQGEADIPEGGEVKITKIEGLLLHVVPMASEEKGK